MITSSFQNEINYILQWVFPCFEKCLLEPHSGVLLRLFVKGNSETRMKILEHIYRLGVVKTLTDSVASQSVGHIIASGTCSTGELEILLLWISPNLKWLLQNKTSGYIVFNMFINSIVYNFFGCCLLIIWHRRSRIEIKATWWDNQFTCHWHVKETNDYWIVSEYFPTRVLLYSWIKQNISLDETWNGDVD